MTEQRLNNCMLLNIHKDLTYSLDLFEIAKDFRMAKGETTLSRHCVDIRAVSKV